MDDDIQFLKSKEEQIKSRTAQTIIENGQDLIEAKAKVGHGNFLKWVEGCLPWGRQTVTNMMNVALKFPTVGNLDEIQAKALYLLAAPSTPESARQEAIDRDKSGETVTHADAKKLVEAHKRIQGLEDNPVRHPARGGRSDRQDRMVDTVMGQKNSCWCKMRTGGHPGPWVLPGDQRKAVA